MSRKNQYGRSVKDSINTLSDSIGIVDGITSSSNGWSDFYDYPEGFDSDNCVVIGVELLSSNGWRSGVGSFSGTIGRVFAELNDSGVRLYRTEANTAEISFRVTLLRVR